MIFNYFMIFVSIVCMISGAQFIYRAYKRLPIDRTDLMVTGVIVFIVFLYDLIKYVKAVM